MTERRSVIPDTIHDRAAEWMVELDRGDSAARRTALSRWLDADPRHRQAFDEARRNWTRGRDLSAHQALRDRTLGPAPFWMRQKTRSVALGATAFATVAIISMPMLGVGSVGWPLATAHATVFETERGQVTRSRLADGTQLTLDTDTEVLVETRGDQQHINLIRGRVRVQSGQSEARDLTIYVGSVALSTSQGTFDISTWPTGPAIDALSGDGRFSAGGKSGTLSGGTQLTIGGSPLLTPSIAQERSWVAGVLFADTMPLQDAVETINRYNDTQIILDAGPMHRVSGGFRVRQPHEFARAAALAFDLEIDRSLRVIRLKPKVRP